MGAEADAKGLKGKDRGDHIRLTVDPYTKLRADQRNATVQKRSEELKIEIPEALKKCKKVGDLKACKNDMEQIVNFLLQILGVKPEDMTLLMTEDLFYQIVKQVSI